MCWEAEEGGEESSRSPIEDVGVRYHTTMWGQMVFGGVKERVRWLVLRSTKSRWNARQPYRSVL